MENINLSSLTNEQLALIIAKDIVRPHCSDHINEVLLAADKLLKWLDSK